MATLTEYLNWNDTNNIGTTTKRFQGFKIAAGKQITGFGIIGSQGNNATAGTFSVSIYEGGTVTSVDSGTLVAYEEYDRSVLGAYTTSPTMHEFTFATPTGALTGGSTQYFLVIHPLTGSSSDCIRWALDTTSPTYTDGSSGFKTTGAWTEQATTDEAFRILGQDFTSSTDVNDSRPAEIAGSITVNSSRDAEVSGIATTASSRDTEVTGATISNATRDAEITGTDNVWTIERSTNGGAWTTIVDSQVIEDVADLYTYDDVDSLVGGNTYCYRIKNTYYDSPWSEPECIVYSTGNVTTDSRGAQISGIATVTSERDAEVTGSTDTNDSVDAEIYGSITSSDSRDAEVHGIDSIASSRASEISGVFTYSDSRSAEIEGFFRPSASRDAEIHGIDSTTSSRDSEVTGSISVDSEVDAEIHGAETDTDSRVSEIHGEADDHSESPAEIFGAITDSASRDSEISGTVSNSDSRSAETTGQESTQDSRDAEIFGNVAVTTSRGSEITGVFGSDDMRSAEIEGYIFSHGFRLGRDNDTGIGIGKRSTPQLGRDNDTNTGIGRKLN